LKEPKLAQLDKEFYYRCTVVHSKGKLVTAPMTIEAESFYDEIKKSDKCKFSEGSHKKLPVRT